MRRLLPALSLVFAVPAFGQAPDIARFRIAETDTSWVTETRCTHALADGTRGCRLIVLSTEDESADDSVRFWIERNGVRSAQWATNVAPYQSLGFDLVRIDLDEDGTPEHVFAHHDAEGNGVGVRTWTLWIVDDRAPDRKPLALTTYEYGDDAYPLVNGHRRLLATFWETGTEPRRGEGSYFAGRLYRYDGAAGTLVPDAAAPVYRRRFTNAFQTERGRTYDAETVRGVPGQSPWRWLQSRSTARLRTDPALPPTSGTTEYRARYFGTVGYEGQLVPLVRRDGGTMAEEVEFVTVLDAPTRRRLPDDYAPRGGWPSTGAPARLVVATGPGNAETVQAVWVER